MLESTQIFLHTREHENSVFRPRTESTHIHRILRPRWVIIKIDIRRSLWMPTKLVFQRYHHLPERLLPSRIHLLPRTTGRIRLQCKIEQLDEMTIDWIHAQRLKPLSGGS